MFQGKVTLKSPKSSERNAISLVDKAKPKAEIQVLKKRALYIPEQIISAEKNMFQRTRSCQSKAGFKYMDWVMSIQSAASSLRKLTVIVG